MSRPGFRTWSVAAALSTLGDSVAYFALGWAAAGHGPGTAGLVLTLESVPLCLLVLLGGVAADRHGIRRTMVACDVAMVLVSAAFLVHALGGASVLGLCLLAVGAGTAAALRRPADGAFPRLWVDDDELPRAVAQVGLLQQVARVAGPALGGVLLGLGGLPLVAGLDLVTFALVAVVLATVRPPRTQRLAAGEPVLRGIGRTVDAARAAGVVPLLAAVSLLAASVLPAVILCVPLVGHERGWGVATAGLVAGCWTVGTFAVTAVTAVVARRGAAGVRARVLGPLLGAGGLVLLALEAPVVVAALGLTLLGVGTAAWTTTALPMLLRAAPSDLVGRFQALLGLAQNVAVMVALPGLGWLASRTGATTTVGVAAVLLAATAVLPWPAPAPAAAPDSGACPTKPTKPPKPPKPPTTSRPQPVPSGSDSASPG